MPTTTTIPPAVQRFMLGAFNAADEARIVAEQIDSWLGSSSLVHGGDELAHATHGIAGSIHLMGVLLERFGVRLSYCDSVLSKITCLINPLENIIAERKLYPSQLATAPDEQITPGYSLRQSKMSRESTILDERIRVATLDIHSQIRKEFCKVIAEQVKSMREFSGKMALMADWGEVLLGDLQSCEQGVGYNGRARPIATVAELQEHVNKWPSSASFIPRLPEDVSEVNITLGNTCLDEKPSYTQNPTTVDHVMADGEEGAPSAAGVALSRVDNVPARLAQRSAYDMGLQYADNLELLDHQIAQGQLVHKCPNGTRQIVRITDDLVVKFGPSIYDLQSEMDAVGVVLSQTTIPVATIYECITRGIDTYLVMDCIEGCNLQSLLPDLTVEEKHDIVLQLRGYVDQLRSIQGAGTAIRGPNGGPCPVPAGVVTSWEGPFQTQAEFIHNLQRHVILKPDTPPPRKVFNDGYDIVFSHGKFRPENILVRYGKVVGIIDWEDSGWYPAYWEFVNSYEGVGVRAEMNAAIMTPYHAELASYIEYKRGH